MRTPPILATVLAIPMLTAFRAPETPPAVLAPPAVLGPYIRNGSFAPGDYGWARGAFDDASPQEKAAYADVKVWLKQSYDAATARAKADLVAMGVDVVDFKPGGPYGDPPYVQVATATPIGQNTSWATFQRDLATARAYADSFLFAVSMTEDDGSASTPLREALLMRPVAEQLLRGALGWGQGEVASSAPTLPDGVKPIVARLILYRLATIDRANTQWLDAIVRKDGWPKLSVVGESAAQSAWLLAQHADHNPAFQLRALRAMEPLVKTGDVRPRDYGYLYDRVMLKIGGRQRYGTQMTCDKGKRVPLPLEDAAAVDRLRAELKLSTVSENAARMDKSYGPCPPGA